MSLIPNAHCFVTARCLAALLLTLHQAPAVVVFHDSLADSAALAAQYPSVGWVRI
jgi:hypothetical protein